MSNSVGLNASALKHIIDLHKTHVEKVTLIEEPVQAFGVTQTQQFLLVEARPFKRDMCRCPVCGRVCPRDGFKSQEPSRWRAPNLCHVPVLIQYRPQRILCPEHGALNEALPWKDGNSRFTEQFNNEVAWAVREMCKTAVSMFFGINWRTVGNCVDAVRRRLEPDIEKSRIHCGLRRICVDETSYMDGHKYITVVYDMERSRVVWMHDGNGKQIFNQFCELLTPGEKQQMEIVAGDGARWIDDCTRDHFPNAIRCVDFFHVAQWANDSLDEVRRQLYNRAREDLRRQEVQFNAARREYLATQRVAYSRYQEAVLELTNLEARGGRRTKRRKELESFILEYEEARRQSDVEMGFEPPVRSGGMIPGPRFAMSPEDGRLMENLRRKLKVLKNSRYALGHNPENCTATQKEKLQLIQNSYGAYQMKEGLRLILHLSDASLARERLQRWCHDALNSGIDAFRDLGLKIEHHAVNIVNAIRCHANSSQSEATNTTIKALIRLARGFRNLDNLMSLVYLKCSDLVIPVKNMLQPSNEYQQAMRAQAAENRRQQARDKSDRLLEMKDRDPEADADMDHFGLGSGMAAEA